jgi:hypothetical protein
MLVNSCFDASCLICRLLQKIETLFEPLTICGRTPTVNSMNDKQRRATPTGEQLLSGHTIPERVPGAAPLSAA